MTKFLVIIVCLLVCSGCKQKILSAYTDYVTIENLASYHVGTPDPELESPPFEQRLTIEWVIPLDFSLENTRLNYIIRFRDREEISEAVLIKKRQGRTLFHLTREEYVKTGGVLTYKISLQNDDGLIAEWKHILWKELVELSP